MTKQRWHLYTSESEGFCPYGSCTPEVAQGYYDWVVRTQWWRQHSHIRHIRIKYPIYGRLSNIKMDGKVAIIEFGPFSLLQETLLHELGHVLDYHPEQTDEQDHNPKFAGVLLAVLKRYMGVEESEKLRKQFDERDVKYLPYE